MKQLYKEFALTVALVRLLQTFKTKVFIEVLISILPCSFNFICFLSNQNQSKHYNEFLNCSKLTENMINFNKTNLNFIYFCAFNVSRKIF